MNQDWSVEIPVYDHPEGLQRVVLAPITPLMDVIDLPLGSVVTFQVRRKDYVRTESLP